MRRLAWGFGAVFIGILSGCSGNEPGPSSKVSSPMGGSAGSGGGGLDLGIGGGGTGGGGAGGGGTGGAAGGGGGGAGASGSSLGGASGGSVSGGSGSGSGGMKPAGMCTRAAGSDADCADFWAEEGYTQAYACEDISAAARLADTLGTECASVNFVAGARYGACCHPK